jgi:hypothetical protein
VTFPSQYAVRVFSFVSFPSIRHQTSTSRPIVTYRGLVLTASSAWTTSVAIFIGAELGVGCLATYNWGGMDTHRNTNDSGWTDQSSIPNSFSTKWFEAQINVWARRIDLSLSRIFELGSHWAPAPIAVAAASLREERGWAGPGLRCVSCHVLSRLLSRRDACPVTSVLSRLSCHVGLSCQLRLECEVCYILA